MTDLIIKGTGNSRKLKSVSNFKTLYPTYDKLADALVAGTLPVDILGLNSAGVQTAGTALTKANLLKDATAALYGKGRSATVDQILAAIRPLITTAQNTANAAPRIQRGSYTGTNQYGQNAPNTLSFSFSPNLLIISDGGNGTAFVAVRDAENGSSNWQGRTQISRLTWGDTQVSWWSDYSATEQMNSNNTNLSVKDGYKYIAIG